MTSRVRLLILMARPAVVVLLGLFTATGLAQAGQGENPVLLAKALAVVVGFLLFSVAINDLADEPVDRVNLPGDRRRPLVTGTATRRELLAMGLGAAAVALAAGAALRWSVAAVAAAGLVISGCYSLRPVRVADRGAAASLLLPALYVAVPYLVGVLAGRGSVQPGDLLLLGGLYVGFIGRILLKDFRDVRGDALFGKRTFLVRHGRRRTCQLAAACWVAGTVALASVRQPTWALAGAWVACLAVVLGLLRALSVERGARRDEALISAIAILGRGMVLTLLAHFSMAGAGWSVPAYVAVMGVLVAVTLDQAHGMARHGPTTRLTIPPSWATIAAMPPGKIPNVPAQEAWGTGGEAEQRRRLGEQVGQPGPSARVGHARLHQLLGVGSGHLQEDPAAGGMGADLHRVAHLLRQPQTVTGPGLQGWWSQARERIAGQSGMAVDLAGELAHRRPEADCQPLAALLQQVPGGLAGRVDQQLDPLTAEAVRGGLAGHEPAHAGQVGDAGDREQRRVR